MTSGKTIALTRQTFVGKVMSLLFNMVSRLIMAFLPMNKCLLISWLQSPSAVILEPKKIKSDHRYADDTTLMAEREEELKSLLMKVKEESEKAGLKLNIQKTMIMASSLITSWEIDADTVADLILGASKITADGDCSHEIKRHLLLGRKVMTNLDSILMGRDITLSTKIRLVKAMVFPVVMYGCESWTIKKVECKELMLLNCAVGEGS